MKILAIMGSPRGKGSGYRVVRMIEDRMKALGNVEFAYLFLKDANLKPCTGCYTCLARGEHKCPRYEHQPDQGGCGQSDRGRGDGRDEGHGPGQHPLAAAGEGA